MYRLITVFEPYSESLVREFYANLIVYTSKPNCLKFEKVYVEGHIMDFSPSAISKYYKNFTSIDTLHEILELDEIYAAIAGKGKCHWPSCRYIDAIELGMKYNLLNKISIHIWCLTKNTNKVYDHVIHMALFLYRVGNNLRVDIRHHILVHHMWQS